MNSIWTDSVTLPTFNRLNKYIHTDVLIIGGGITGLLCAYLLDQAGVDCVLVEANEICSGISKNTTAKITSQHGLLYADLIKKYGAKKASMYLRANEIALNKYKKLCKHIDCEFEEKDSYVYSLRDSTRLMQELFALNKIGFPAEYVKEVPLPFPTCGAIRFPNQAQFNPLQFLAAISKDLQIYEHTTVKNIKNHTAVTTMGKITANKTIVTTHFPFLNRRGSYFLKLYQHRSYVLALEHASEVNGMFIDESETGLSFRNYKNLLLLGGGSHRTGKEGGNWSELIQFANQYYPEASIRYRWATQDCMSLDGIPYIGHYSANTPHLYVATGFYKWGMTSAMAAACILCDKIVGKPNSYAAVFSPSRNMLHPQLAVNAFEAVTNLFSPAERCCPHMGCSLKWNPQEHSWDCPCHGSRFTEDGNLIDNPSTRDLP